MESITLYHMLPSKSCVLVKTDYQQPKHKSNSVTCAKCCQEGDHGWVGIALDSIEGLHAGHKVHPCLVQPPHCSQVQHIQRVFQGLLLYYLQQYS